MQPDLFTKLVEPTYDPGATIQQRFEKFDAANPRVYSALVGLAFKAKNAGRTRIGMKHLAEVFRWNYGQTHGEEFKLNNNFSSRYVRMICGAHPDLAPLFELRRLRSE